MVDRCSTHACHTNGCFTFPCHAHEYLGVPRLSSHDMYVHPFSHPPSIEVPTDLAGLHGNHRTSRSIVLMATAENHWPDFANFQHVPGRTTLYSATHSSVQIVRAM